jgi:hypothetical protein
LLITDCSLLLPQAIDNPSLLTALFGAMPRYAIRIAPDALLAVSRTAFDPPDDLFFTSRDRAEGFCESLNRCLGYQRYIVVELASDSGAQDEGQRKTGGSGNGEGFLVYPPDAGAPTFSFCARV